MSSIDERIVELQFNNGQFESGVQQSLSTLDKLKSALNLGASAQGLKGLGDAGKTLGDAGLGNVSTALDAVTNKFSLFGTIGDQVIRRLTDSVMGFGRKVLTAIPNQIIEGGKRRSQNISNAQFQLEGLMKEAYDWKKISEDISYAVQDTAYGFDEAALAASQYYASGIKFGDQMKESLRAISGVAAMTNSSYSDTARVFTTVAGQGRLMGDQLNQLAARGLNVAATLGESMGKTEEEIRKMVSKGEIDFETFAHAMDKAFGPHAKEAEKTFNGALANMKASLSRMGEQFATPAYEALRRIFIGVKGVFKEIEQLIKPLSGAFTVLTEAVTVFAENGLKRVQEYLHGLIPEDLTDRISSMQESLREFFGLNKEQGTVQSKVVDAAGKVVDLSKKTFMTGGQLVQGILFGSEEAQEALDDLKGKAQATDDVIQRVINGDYGNGEERRKRLTEEYGSWEEIQNGVNEVLGCSKRWEVSQKKNTKLAADLSKTTADVAKNTKQTRFDMLVKGLAGVKSALNMIKRLGDAVYKNTVKPLMAWAVPTVITGFLKVFSTIGTALTELDQWTAKTKLFEGITKGISDFASTAKTKIVEFLNVVRNLKGVQLLGDSFNKLGESLKKLAAGSIEKIGKAFESIINAFGKFDVKSTKPFTDFVDALSSISAKGLTSFSNVLNNLGNFGTKISKLDGVKKLVDALTKLKNIVGGFISDKLTAITDWLNGLNGEGKKFDINVWSAISDAINKVTSSIAGFIDDTLDGKTIISDVFNFISSAGSSVVGVLTSLGRGFINFFKSFKDLQLLKGLGDVFKKIGEGIKSFAKDVVGALNPNGLFQAVSSFERNFVNPLKKDPTQIIEAIKSLPNKLKDIFSQIKIGDWIKNLFSKSNGSEGKGFIESLFDGINPSTITTKISTAFSKIDIIGTIKGIFKSKAKGSDLGQEVVDETLGDSKSLYEKAKNFIKGIGDAIKDVFNSVDWGGIGKWAALATAGLMIFRFVSFIASAAKLAVSIPLGSIKALDTLRGSLKAYEARIKSEALINVSKAIFIFAAALVVLAQVPSDKLDSVVGTVASLALLGVLIAAFYTRMKAVYGQMKAMPVNPLVMSIQVFLFGIKRAVIRAGNLVGVAAIIIAVGVAVGMLVHTMDVLVSNKPVLDNAQDALNVLASIAVIIAGVGIAMGLAGKHFTGGSGVAVYLIAASIERLVNLMLTISSGEVNWNQAYRAVGMILIIAGIFVAIGGVIGLAGKSFGVGSGAGIFVIELAIERLVNIILMLSSLENFDPKKLFICVGLIASLGAILTVMGGVLGQLAPEKMMAVSGAIAGMAAGMLLLCVPILLLSKVPVDQLAQGITAVGVAFMILVFAGYAANGAAVGLAAISGVLMGIASAMISFALAAAIFGAALYLVGGGLDFFLGALPSIGEKLGALLGPLLSALKDLVVNLVNGLKIMIVEVYNWVVANGPEVIGKALAYLIKFVLVDMWRYGFMLLGAIGNILGRIANSLWGKLMEMTSGVRGKINYFLDSISLWLFEGFRNTFGKVLELLHLDDDIDNVIDGIKNRMSEYESSIKESTEGLGEAGAEGAENAKEKIDQSVEGIEESVNGLEVDNSKAEQAVAEGYAGIASVIGQQGGEIQKSAQEVLDPNSLMSDFDISGTWEQVGAMIPEALTGSLDGGKEGVQSSYLSMLDPIINPSSAGIDFSESGKGLVDGYISNITEQFGNADMSGALGEFYGQFEKYSIDGSGLFSQGETLGKQLPEGLSKGINDYKDVPLDNAKDLMESLTKPNGIDIKPQYQDMGSYIPKGLGDGMLASIGDATGSAKQVVDEVLNTYLSGFGIASPSKETYEMGEQIDAGLANGVRSMVGVVKSAVTSVALASLAAIAAKVPLFKPYGASAGTYYALGILSKKSAATAAGSSIASASVDGAKSKNASAKGAGIGLGDKMVDGVKSREDAAYRAGARLAEKAIQGFKDKWKKNDPTKDLSNIAPTGNSPGVVRASKDAYSAGSKIGSGAVEGLKKAVEIAKDILEDGIDINPTITPVLDLSQIQNGVGALNGLISPSTINLGRLNASINASRGSDDKVIDAINSLKAGMKPTGDTYIIEGITYDDGSNVSDAVRTLVTAARKKRRA